MSGRMALIVAGVLFAVFGLNVVLGSMGSAQFLGDLGELWMVIGSVIFFVIAILLEEKKVNGAAEGQD